MTEQNPKTNGSKITKWQMTQLAFDMGYIIAFPIVAFGLLGKFLDAKYNTRPVMTLVGIALAILLTTVWLTKKIKKYLNRNNSQS
ncbi:MAG: AtpZ/AtpI family protein [Candidatus Doudnabacteria bacterium]|nr:AtpZ/AtpI family protein [Candidatus Doudnabacteria bacterium]